jgi:hypothetical protein
MSKNPIHTFTHPKSKKRKMYLKRILINLIKSIKLNTLIKSRWNILSPRS